MYQRPKWSYLYISLALEFYLRVSFSCECPPNCVLNPFSSMPIVSESSIILTFSSHLFQDHYFMIVLFQVWILYFHSAQSETRAQNPGPQDTKSSNQHPGSQNSGARTPRTRIQDTRPWTPVHETQHQTPRDTLPRTQHPGLETPRPIAQDLGPHIPEPIF